MITAAKPLLLGLTVALLVGCTPTPSTGFTVTGTVDDVTQIVAAPLLLVPVANLDAGFPDQPDATTAAPDPAVTLGLGTMLRLTSVSVSEGDQVVAGQVVAIIDDGTLQANLEVARTNQQAAKAQIGRLGSAIDEASDKARDVKDARKKVSDAIKQATKMKSQLAKAQTQLKKVRKDLVKKLSDAEALLNHYPPIPPAGIPTPEELQAAITQLKAGIKKVDANLAKIKAAKPKLTAGLAKARKASKKLDDATVSIADAKAALSDAKKLATISAAVAVVGVDLAQAQLDRTVLTAPVAGVVTHAAQVGDLLAPGATVIEIRPDAASTITAWLSPSQAAQVCLGDPVAVRGDWMPPDANIEATLTRLGTGYQYPPSNVTTDEIHLTRALEIQLTATTDQLPPGVPVDLTITGCHPASHSETKE